MGGWGETKAEAISECRTANCERRDAFPIPKGLKTWQVVSLYSQKPILKHRRLLRWGRSILI